MKNTGQPHFNRRTRTRKEIKQLIAERNNVLAQFYSLTNHIDAHKVDDIESLQDLIQEFCQNMIDYIATGHFEIYHRLEEDVERRSDMLELGNQVYDKIRKTTRIAIKFNDHYDVANKFRPETLKNFPQQLTELGENLAVRIELEDHFINTLLSPVPQPAAYDTVN